MVTSLLECEPDWLAAASLDDWHANILCVGEIAPAQNLNLAVLAFAEYRRVFDPFARLIFAGPQTDPAYAKQLREFVQSQNLGGCVLMTDATDVKQQKALYLTADAVLQTGKDENTAEAAAFRVPVASVRQANTPRKLAEALNGAIHKG